MALDEQPHHIALPKLYGAPAYARPPRLVADTPRPFDPDDLPIEAAMTEEDRVIASSLPAHAYAPGGRLATDPRSLADPQLTPRPLSLRTLAGRLLGQGQN